MLLCGWFRFVLQFPIIPPLYNLLGTVESIQATNDITVTFMFHNFLTSLRRSNYLFLFSGFSILTQISWNGKVHYMVSSQSVYSFESFSLQHLLMVFHWSLSDSKSLQVSRTLLSILAYLSNSVIGCSSFVLLYPSPSHLVPILWWPYQVRQLPLVSQSCLCSIVYYHSSPRESFSTTNAVERFLESEWQHVSKICVTETLLKPLCIKCSFLVPSLILFCVCLLYARIMWFFASSLLPHKIHLLFCCVISIFALI